LDFLQVCIFMVIEVFNPDGFRPGKLGRGMLRPYKVFEIFDASKLRGIFDPNRVISNAIAGSVPELA
jgi:hypothetical protein